MDLASLVVNNPIIDNPLAKPINAELEKNTKMTRISERG
jgi:hypothetical protein